MAGRAQATLTEEAGSRAADIAWLITPDQQSAGLATEAAEAMVGWLHALPVDVLCACIHPQHRASARVAEKLGLEATSGIVDGEVVWERR